MGETEEEANFFSSCLKKIVDVNDILCRNADVLCIKKNNCVKDSELEADSTFDLSFAIKVKMNEATPEIEYIEIPLQRTISTYKYCYIFHSIKNLIIIPKEA